MSADAGQRLVQRLERRWRARLESSGLLLALAVALPAASLAIALRGTDLSRTLGRVSIGLLAVGAIVALVRARRLTRREDIVRHLDRVVPSFEDSAELLAPMSDDRPPLEELQRQRLLTRIEALEERRLLPAGPLRRAVMALLASTLLSAVLIVAGSRWGGVGGDARAGGDGTLALAPAGPGLAELAVRIEPPAYTGVAVSSAESLALEVPEGSSVEWSARLTGEFDRALLDFDAARELELEPGGAGEWGASTVVREPHVYELRLERDGEIVWRSGHARLRVVADQPPTLRLVRPQPVVELAEEEAARVALAVEVADDYGVVDATVVATLTTGAGESVRFREQRLSLGTLAGGAGRGSGLSTAQSTVLGRDLELEELGMTPGAELYYYVEARDGRRPEPNRARSSTFVIRIAGGRGASVGLGAGLPILRLPEFFRSQRQIILDTEKLLAEEDSVTRSELVRRSEGLGFEQRALRMRYAGLLGEEFESGLPPGSADPELADAHGEEEELTLAEEAASGGIAEALAELPEGFVHSHDSAEIATYFDSRVKDQLKQAMEEMWGSEGRLRSIAPAASLPYQYRALKLLKSAQEAERVYVQKVGFEPPPLAPRERRLTGDLSDVRSATRVAGGAPVEAVAEVRRALAALDVIMSDGGAAFGELISELEPARSALAQALRATSGDAGLEGLDGLESVLAALAADTPPEATDLAAARRALNGLLPRPDVTPRRAPRAGALHGRYRGALEEPR